MENTEVRNMEEIKKKQKELACKCLRHFDMLEPVLKDFESEEKVYYSERQNKVFDGILFWMSNHPEWVDKIRQLEEKYNILVYHAYLYHTAYGAVLDCLYVPAEEEEWEYVLDNIKDGIANVYAIDFDEPFFSEFGLGQYAPCNGGITKIA